MGKTSFERKNSLLFDSALANLQFSYNLNIDITSVLRIVEKFAWILTWDPMF